MPNIQNLNEMKIPYYDESHVESFWKSLKNSAKRRNINVVIFAFRKLFNTILFWVSYTSPFKKVRVTCNRLRGVKASKKCTIQVMCSIDNAYPEYVIIKDNAGVNQGTTIIAHTNTQKAFKNIFSAVVKPVILEEGCLVGINCTILPGVRIGKMSVVSAGSVVTKDVDDYTIVAGNPARKIANIKKLL